MTPIMPRPGRAGGACAAGPAAVGVAALALAAALGGAAACSFRADYGGGTYRCSDGVCPAGLACVAGTCEAPRDGGAVDAHAAIDASPAAPDARAALTCGDPGLLARGAAVMASGTTAGGQNHVSSACGAAILNGPDAVFRVTAQAGDRLDVGLAGDAIVRAYVVTSCAAPPSTPACEGNAFVAAGASPLQLTGLAAGPHYILVDSENAALGGAYTLTVDLRP